MFVVAIVHQQVLVCWFVGSFRPTVGNYCYRHYYYFFDLVDGCFAFVTSVAVADVDDGVADNTVFIVSAICWGVVVYCYYIYKLFYF